jgi:transcriptional regulator with XRE-family HTH domain
MKSKRKSRFAKEMWARMHAKGLTLKDLATLINMSYEHMRKIASGEAYPSKWALRDVCAALDINLDEAQNLLIADRIEGKWGGIPYSMVGKHPELSMLAPFWDNLTNDQKATFRGMIESMAAENERRLPTMQKAS